MDIKIDLRSLREQTSLSQTDLAKILGFSQAQVSRYEKGEQRLGDMPVEKLLTWLQTLGVDIALAMTNAIPSPQPINPGDPYKQLRRQLDLLEQYISDHAPTELEIPNLPPQVSALRVAVKRYRQKPNLVLVGQFDSGKSTLANTIMGVDVLHTELQPATRVITFICSLDDRPQWCQDEVLILDRDFWRNDESDSLVFDLTLLDNQSWCQQHTLHAGSQNILRQYGVHDHFTEEQAEGHSAVIYIDSPILKACNVIDFPGYSDQEEDVERANSAVQMADLALYTSTCNGFINASDSEQLRHLLRSLPAPERNNQGFPTLGNFFVVATLALPHIADSQIEKLLNVASQRFYRQVNDTILAERSQRIDRPIVQDDLRERFFSFLVEVPERRTLLEHQLKDALEEYFPQTRQRFVEQEIKQWQYYVPVEYQKKICAYEEMISELQQRKDDLQKLEEEEPQRLEEIQKQRQQISQKIETLRQQTKRQLKATYSDLVNAAAIETVIRRRYDDKKEAQQYAAGYFIEQLQARLEAIIKPNADLLKTDIDRFLQSYDDVFLKLPSFSVGSVTIPFNAKGAFIGGLAGLGGVGALSVWAASLGNLGAYILVAKAVSLLSALGISISGGVATAVSAVAAIGGPITLGIGLVLAAVFGGLALFGESWQRRLAKKLVEQFEKQGVLSKFQHGGDRYWLDTAKAFDQGANTVEEQFSSYIQHLRDLTADDTTSRDHIEMILGELRKSEAFFSTIPWVFSEHFQA